MTVALAPFSSKWVGSPFLPIRRPKDKDGQKKNYSGKKKSHRKKNLLVATGDKQVMCVGPARPGSVHDKKWADESELLLTEKKRNHLLSHCRVGVEHVISGIKRCRIVFDAFRHLRAGFVDAVMEVAGGLHNPRVTTRGCTLE